MNYDIPNDEEVRPSGTGNSVSDVLLDISEIFVHTKKVFVYIYQILPKVLKNESINHIFFLFFRPLRNIAFLWNMAFHNSVWRAQQSLEDGDMIYPHTGVSHADALPLEAKYTKEDSNK